MQLLPNLNVPFLNAPFFVMFLIVEIALSIVMCTLVQLHAVLVFKCRGIVLLVFLEE